MNIILIGFMGSGKTTVGRMVAEKLCMDFIDTDQLIEKKCNKTIFDIFEEKGENFFREKERYLIKKTLKKKINCVISTGGGMPCYKDNMKQLKSIGKTIYLKIDFDILKKRISARNRPLFQDIEKAEQLFNKRKTCYENADEVINSGGDLENTISQIIKLADLP